MRTLYFALMICALAATAHARICVKEFRNDSFIPFRPFDSNTLVAEDGASIESDDGSYRIVLEDAGRSGYHRPHWKFHVWLESKEGFDLIAQNKILYAVIFYDGDGEVSLHVDNCGKLHVSGGTDVLYPWAVGTIGRGTAYHQIQGKEVDENGIIYFDNDGFVGLPYNSFID